MRKVLLLAVAILFTGISMANNGFTVNYSQNSDSERQLSFTVGEYSIQNVTIDGQTYSKIIFDGQIISQQKGWAELPFISSSIQISNDKNVSVEVANSQYVDIELDYPLLPSRGVIYRNQDPTTIPYEIDPASVIDAFYPKAITRAEAPYILRDIRGTSVKVYPFRYNAKQNTLRVYTQVDVNVNDDNTEVINPKTKVNATVLREMDAMYKSIFINYTQNNKDLAVGDYGDLLVICTERDEDAIQPFIDWKKEKGFNVAKEVVEVATNVKSLIQDAYDNNPDLLYVQLVGDWADIKCDLGGGANAPMDPMLGCVEGSDWLPEIAIGRFSGNSPAHITVQVNKAITYEKLPETDAAWYSHSLGVGSDEGSGNGDDGEMDKTHIQIIYDNKLDPFSYDQQYQSYAPGANSNQVATAVNEGNSIANYCGHGSNTAWVTSGFSNSNISQLTNGNKLPFIISVACVNGAFHQGECFGEAWLKKDGGGAVMTLMATINQPWQPPMRGQDYMNDILTGGYDYNNNPGNGTNTEEGRTFLGPIVVNGLILMYDESSGGSDLETIQTWTTFGDCSLQPRTIAPAELSVSNETVINGVDFNTIITSDGVPVEGAMIGLTQADGGLFYNAITDENGEVTITHELIPGDAKLVVTAMNTQTIYLDIVVISPEGAYLVIEGFEMNTTDGMAVYDSEVSMSLTFENLGSDAATDVVISLTSESDEYCTLISNASVNLGDIAADGFTTFENVFTFEVTDNVPDQHTVSLTFDINDSSKDLWQEAVDFNINAPALNIVFIEVDDTEGGNGNGRLDAGETATLVFNGLNIGHADSPDALMLVNTSSEFITINNTSVDLGVLSAQGGALAGYEVVVSEDAPIGIAANISADVSAGSYNFNRNMMLNIGLVVEDWESGDFIQYDWQFAGDAGWEITEGSNVYEGTYSAKSMEIGHNQSASLSIDVNVTEEGPISFFLKVSSHTGYDKLKFFIDDNEQDEWSGEVDWEMAEYSIPEGEHTLTWTYSKNVSVSLGDDCAWIDYIVLPGATSGAPLFADFYADIQNIGIGESVLFSSNSIGEILEYDWTFEGGNPATSNEENPSVVYNTPGTYSVTLSINDGVNENTMVKDDFIMVNVVTNVNQLENLNISIYPNPNNGRFTIKLNQNSKVEIINALGKILFAEEFSGKQTIDLSQYAEGIYFVKVETEKESIVKKIIIR